MAKLIAPRLGVAPQHLMIMASVVFAPLGLLYILSFKFMVIVPVLQRWAKREGVMLGHVRRRSGWSAPRSVSAPVLQTNQYQGWYSAEILAEDRVTGMAFFRLLIIAPIGFATIRAATVEMKTAEE